VFPERKDVGLVVPAGPLWVDWAASEREFAGAVLSTLTAKLAVAELPALSVAVPLAVVSVSLVKTWSDGHEARPELTPLTVGSLQV
jgi:hypothetical protein